MLQSGSVLTCLFPGKTMSKCYPNHQEASELQGVQLKAPIRRILSVDWHRRGVAWKS